MCPSILKKEAIILGVNDSHISILEICVSGTACSKLEIGFTIPEVEFSIEKCLFGCIKFEELDLIKFSDEYTPVQNLHTGANIAFEITGYKDIKSIKKTIAEKLRLASTDLTAECGELLDLFKQTFKCSLKRYRFREHLFSVCSYVCSQLQTTAAEDVDCFIHSVS